MRIIVLGGGPAGLAFATLRKRRHPGDDITVIEQNAADATFGFGVVFSDRALDFLRLADEATHALITPHLETWSDITLAHRGETIAIDGIGFSAVGRLELLSRLIARARAVGVEVVHGRRIDGLTELDRADLLIGADGLNSLVRARSPDRFGERIDYSSNHFAWFGTQRRFETLTQTFAATDRGVFNAHHYRFAPDRSTFIVECDAATFDAYGFAGRNETESADVCADVFRDALAGAALISNRSTWRRFPHLTCARWVEGRHVLMGDAAHTAHFSIGSGTRLAIEDAIALADALDREGDIDLALAAYQAARMPVVAKLAAAARASADWYDDFRTHMALDPAAFSMSYIQRTGRVDPAKLRKLSPRFAARYAGGAS